MILSLLKPALLAFLLFWQTTPHPSAAPAHLRYRRPISYPLPSATKGGQTCAVLDADVLTHAAPSLKDLRLYSGKTEVPYAITLSESIQQDSEDARILNLGSRSGHIVFDLEMPHRPYTTVALDLAGQDYIATAEVLGSDSLAAPHPTRLGSFTLFDLTSQHLSHSTILPLAESRFPYLHVELALVPAPGTSTSTSALNRPEIVKTATVPPSREAQTIYTTLQQTTSLAQHDRLSVATFQVPVRAPVERISFVLAPGFKGDFSRAVHIAARPNPGQNSDASSGLDSQAEDEPATTEEAMDATIQSLHHLEAGHEISYQNLSIPTAIGSNMQRSATLEVAVDNGDDAPLPIAAVQLQMRQRRICFEASAAASPLTLYYGDPALEAPVYDYEKLFRPAATPLAATLGPEAVNPTFIARSETRPFTERHPELLWIALLAVVCILALTAIKSAKKLPR